MDYSVRNQSVNPMATNDSHIVLDVLNVSAHRNPQEEYARRYFALPETRANFWISHNVPPILLFVGVAGNMLSLAVLLRPAMRRLSTYAILAALCVADSMALILGCLPITLEHTTDYVLHDRQEWACKLNHYLHYVFIHYSSWLLVAVTVERYIAVAHPLKAQVLCSRHRSYKMMAFLMLFFCVVNLHVFWTFTLSQNAQRSQCTASPEHESFIDGPWQWIETGLYAFIPFVTILTFNILIIQQVCHAKRQRCHLVINGQRMASSDDTDRRMTLMLLSITFVFLVLALPINIMLILGNLPKSNADDLQQVIERHARFQLATTISRVLMNINHTVNFVIYCTTGRKFRQELRRLCCWLCVYRDYQAGRRSSNTASSLTIVYTHRTGRSSPWISPNPSPRHSPCHTPRPSLVWVIPSQKARDGETSAGLMLGRRRRRWPNINPTLVLSPRVCRRSRWPNQVPKILVKRFDNTEW